MKILASKSFNLFEEKKIQLMMKLPEGTHEEKGARKERLEPPSPHRNLKN
jgi:hypothetical protein